MPQQEPPQAPYEYQTSDPVDSPAHYRRGDVEAIEIIEHIVSSYKDPVQSFLVGQILKYLIRAPLKWNQAEDLKKGHWYYRRLVEKTR